MSSLIGQTVSHYMILEKLGAGGMGVVYKAEDLKLDRFVALKFLPPDLIRDPQARTRFLHEAKAASALQHNNICTVHDVDETADGALFIVMDLYDGETLKEKIDRGPLQISEARDLAVQIVQGLSEAHRAGIIHRDIKPANIYITKSGVAKILDFGLAKLCDRTMLTKAGSTKGTAAYMSPEQASGETVDQRTDIWSLGVVLYEMLTGQRPFKAEYENALIYSILNTEPRPPSHTRRDLPASVDGVVAKCLAKSPDDRYGRIDELIADLHSMADDNVQSRRPRTPTGSPRRRNRKRIWYGVATLGALGMFLTSYLLYFSPRGIERSPSEPKMIAVLPFENLGPAEDEYFADGLTEEITSRLGSISGLGVISRQSSIQYKKSTKTLPVVAKELGVDYILAATIRWVRNGSEQRIRMTPHLFQVSGDRQLWSENMDRTLDDIFRVQTDIATQVVHALGVVLSEQDRGVIAAIPTKNLEAYQAYLRGLSSLANIYQKVNVQMAVEMFERAVDRDSTFAVAYVALSLAHLGYHWAGFDRTDNRLERSKQALDRAFALQSDLAEAHVALARYYYAGYRDYERALETLTKAEKKLPNDSRVLALLGYIRRRQGRFEEAVEELMKASKFDPKNAGIHGQIGNTLLQLGKYPEAERYLNQAISLEPDQALDYKIKSDMYLYWQGDTRKCRSILEHVPTAYFPWESFVRLDIYERNYQAALDRLKMAPDEAFVAQHAVTPVTQLRGFILRFMGDTGGARASFDSAREFLESQIEKRPDDYRLYMSLGLTLAGLGRTEEAIRNAARATELMPLSTDAVSGVWPQIAMAQVYTLVGRDSAGLGSIESLLSLHAPKFLTVPLLRLDPIYDPLRNNPRFQTLLTRYD